MTFNRFLEHDFASNIRPTVSGFLHSRQFKDVWHKFQTGIKSWNTMTLYTAKLLFQQSLWCTVTTSAVTTWWLPLCWCSDCCHIPHAVTTTSHTHTALGIHYHGAFVEIWYTRHRGWAPLYATTPLLNTHGQQLHSHFPHQWTMHSLL